LSFVDESCGGGREERRTSKKKRGKKEVMALFFFHGYFRPFLFNWNNEGLFGHFACV